MSKALENARMASLKDKINTQEVSPVKKIVNKVKKIVKKVRK